MLRFNELVRSLENNDLILVDTRGTKGITVDMSVLASDLVISPLKPELLSAREFVRGAIGLYQQLQVFTKNGFKLPQLKAVINCPDKTNDAKVDSIFITPKRIKILIPLSKGLTFTLTMITLNHVTLANSKAFPVTTIKSGKTNYVR